MVLLRQRMKWLANGGNGGDTVPQMLARTDALLVLNPGWLIGFGHINSVSANVTAASIIADLTAIFNKAAAKGVRVVWGTDWVDSPKTAAQRAVAYAVNEWLRKQVEARRGFYLADYQAIFVDPATGNPIAAYASDGLHQDGIGSRLLADQLAKILDPLVPQQDRLIASNDDKTNLLPNGMLVGAAANGYATGWGYNGTAAQGVPSKVARTDGFPGEWQQVVVTDGTDYSLRNRIAAGVADSWVIEDTVYAECEFETDAAGWAATEFNLNLALFNVPAGTVTRSADMIHINGSPASSSRPARGIFRTPPLTIVAGNTHWS
jgi:hypothetical protein